MVFQIGAVEGRRVEQVLEVRKPDPLADVADDLVGERHVDGVEERIGDEPEDQQHQRRDQRIGEEAELGVAQSPHAACERATRPSPTCNIADPESVTPRRRIGASAVRRNRTQYLS